MNLINWFWPKKNQNKEEDTYKEVKDTEKALPPGRISVPNDTSPMQYLKDQVAVVTPSFRKEYIPLIRSLYKINPDLGITIQDMFKLSNTGHFVQFPGLSEKESLVRQKHLEKVSKTWSNYTAGIDGLVTKMIVQCFIGGAISLEAVPNADLSGISTLVFVNPEDIAFRRLTNGVYHPYQIVRNCVSVGLNKDLIKLNTETYTYISMYNDTDEPYGIPPFLTALDSLDGQANMKTNFKHIMEQAGMLGFLQANMAKPARNGGESERAYAARLSRILTELKTRLVEGVQDGILVGYEGDHQFDFTSTSKDLGNADKLWNMNQQSVANGLGVNGNIIGIKTSDTEGGAGIIFSKMISQLKNIQSLVSFVLSKIYLLELRLAGFKTSDIKVQFGTSTVSDELKVQQAIEIKLRNLVVKYQQGIIGQDQFARELGYEKADRKEPRVDPSQAQDDVVKKNTRESDKDKSDRTQRDKDKTVPKRKDHETKPR